MALYDNRHWLLSHLKNSFISSDDTGMCEAIILDGIPKDSSMFAEHEKFPNSEDSSDDEDEFNNSVDMHLDSDLGAHRFRSNTAMKLAKLEQEMKKAAQIKHIKWDSSQIVLPTSEEERIFEKKEVTAKKGPFKSLLSLQLEKCPTLPRNPFTEYAKFGGNAQVGMPTRLYKVFLTMLPLPERNYPINVCVLGSACVNEMIGYVCWKFTTENTDTDFQFKEDISNYGLFIAEDDGEVDWDFSQLDRKETVGKFGLAYLALVEMSERQTSSEQKLEEQRLAEGNVIAKLAGPSNETDEWKQIRGDLTAIEALLYQSFPVSMITKMRTRTDVVLGINGEKMEIDPVVTNTKVGGKIWKHKSASYDMDDVVFCDLLETRGSGRSVFRIVRRAASAEENVSLSSPLPSSSTFKNIDFEVEHKIADEIVRKVNLILHLKCSVHRRDYLTIKNKKLGRRRSFSIWPR